LAHADVAEQTQDPEQPTVKVTPPSSVAPAETIDYTSPQDDTPPLSGGRLFGEAALGTAFAIGGAYGGGARGYAIEASDSEGCSGNEWCGVGGAVLGGGVGLMFAAPVGVYLAGSANGQTGSFGAALGGSALGLAAGVATAFAADDGGVAMAAIV